MQAEELGRIGPGLDRLPASASRQRLKFRHRIFVGVLGVNARAGSKGKCASEHGRRLLGEAHDVDLHAPGSFVIDRLMREALKIERAVKFAIDAGEQVEIERSRHTTRIGIGRKQNIETLLEIDAEQKSAIRPQ